MRRTAARVADGVILMMTPPRYLHCHYPTIEEGLAAIGRDRGDFEICLVSGSWSGLFPVESDAELKAALDLQRSAAPYYFSVPNYRPMLEIHGYGDLQPALHTLRYSNLPESQKWARMTRMIPDELLLAVGTYAPGCANSGPVEGKIWAER